MERVKHVERPPPPVHNIRDSFILKKWEDDKGGSSAANKTYANGSCHSKMDARVLLSRCDLSSSEKHRQMQRGEMDRGVGARK